MAPVRIALNRAALRTVGAAPIGAGCSELDSLMMVAEPYPARSIRAFAASALVANLDKGCWWSATPKRMALQM